MATANGLFAPAWAASMAAFVAELDLSHVASKPPTQPARLPTQPPTPPTHARTQPPHPRIRPPTSCPPLPPTPHPAPANGEPEVWDSFMESIEPIASRVPYMVQNGNHE